MNTSEVKKMQGFVGARVTIPGGTYTVLRFEQEAQGVRAFIRWDDGREHNFIAGAIFAGLPKERVKSLLESTPTKVELANDNGRTSTFFL